MNEVVKYYGELSSEQSKEEGPDKTIISRLNWKIAVHTCNWGITSQVLTYIHNAQVKRF